MKKSIDVRWDPKGDGAYPMGGEQWSMTYPGFARAYAPRPIDRKRPVAEIEPDAAKLFPDSSDKVPWSETRVGRLISPALRLIPGRKFEP